MMHKDLPRGSGRTEATRESDTRMSWAANAGGSTLYLQSCVLGGITTPEAAMSHAIRTRVIRIGNSHGIRIPKTLLEQAGLLGDVEIFLEGGRLVVCAATRARAGWEDAFRAMAERGDDTLLDAEPLASTEWDMSEWQW